MTNAQIEAIFTDALPRGNRISALRAVWNAGWYEGKGTVPTTTSVDQSLQIAKPVAVIQCWKK